MRCREFQERFEDWLGGKVSDDLRTLLESHRASCPACGALVHRAAKASRLLRLVADEPPVPGPGFYTRLQAQIRAQEEQEQRWGPMEAWARRLAWGLSVAIVVLAIYLNVTAPGAVTPPPQAQWTVGTVESQDVLAGPRMPLELDRNQVMVSLVVESGR